VFTATSGSTGQPFYFPRGQALDWQSSINHEMFLRTSGLSREKSTLVIVGFGMGVWIGGLITYRAFSLAASRGWPVTILTTGANKKEILDAVKNIGTKFDQIILCGYPPFIKDVIDAGVEEGVKWWKCDIRIVFAAESFSEEFRDYMIRMIGKKDKYRTTMSVYGSADLGTMAEETPISILTRRNAISRSQIYKNIFGDVERLPTLAQFNPAFINFETPEGEVLCTADNTIPLIRYEIGDHGGTLSYDQIIDAFAREGSSLTKLAKAARLENTIAKLPFVYIYERSDFSTKLYGAIIYPEHIRVPLLAAGFRRMLTGKFKMATRHTKKHEEYLELNIELKPGVQMPRSLGHKIEQAVVAGLLKKNAEYHYLHGLMPKRVVPKTIFREYGHPEHFRGGVKQKWVEK
jgi:phenylacetate-CoA ligase